MCACELISNCIKWCRRSRIPLSLIAWCVHTKLSHISLSGDNKIITIINYKRITFFATDIAYGKIIIDFFFCFPSKNRTEKKPRIIWNFPSLCRFSCANSSYYITACLCCVIHDLPRYEQSRFLRIYEFNLLLLCKKLRLNNVEWDRVTKRIRKRNYFFPSTMIRTHKTKTKTLAHVEGARTSLCVCLQLNTFIFQYKLLEMIGVVADSNMTKNTNNSISSIINRTFSFLFLLFSRFDFTCSTRCKNKVSEEDRKNQPENIVCNT